MKKESYWSKALNQTELAIREESLIPIKTDLTLIQISTEEHFEVRKLRNPFPTKRNQLYPIKNPFSPWDNNLEIAAINNTHTLILNKYPVELGHLLLITNNWLPQDGWLTNDDFTALLHVNEDTSGLWFFNSGPLSGASQPHRHIQLIPRSDVQKICPRINWFNRLLNKTSSKRTKLSNNTYISKYDKDSHSAGNNNLYEIYLTLCAQSGIGNPNNDNKPTHPYNLIITDEWMTLITRKIDGIEGFSINALGFAGYLLCSSNSNVEWLDQNGPERLLDEVVENYQ